MTRSITLDKKSVLSIIIACLFALMAAFMAIRPQRASADGSTPPPVPSDLAVGQGYKSFLLAHATGTQDYICLPSSSSPTGFAWTFLRPQAILFDDEGGQIATHFLSPNPDEAGEPRATWLHSQDTSTVWARAVASSTDPAFVAPGAIPWLLLKVEGAEDGPGGGDRLSGTKFIQRVNTSGGRAPTDGCSTSGQVGDKIYRPYTADYVFYKIRD